MKFKKWITHSVLTLCLFSFGCRNALDGMSDKNSDEALLEDARKAMNESDWDLALEKFESLTDEGKADHTTIFKWSTAYAGKCGLNFVDFFMGLGSADLSGSTIFSYFMNAWTGKTILPAYCTLAQEKMEEISSNAANRTSEQNLFLAILGMVKVGVYLKDNLDRDDDGTAETNPCTDDASNLSKAQLTEVVTGFGLISTNLVYLTAVLADGAVTDALDTVNTACSIAPGACGRTDPADVTDADRDAFRDLLKTSSSNSTAPVGVGNCVDPLVAPCC